MKRRYTIDVDWGPAELSLNILESDLDDYVTNAVEGWAVEIGTLMMDSSPEVRLVHREELPELSEALDRIVTEVSARTLNSRKPMRNLVDAQTILELVAEALAVPQDRLHQQILNRLELLGSK